MLGRLTLLAALAFLAIAPSGARAAGATQTPTATATTTPTAVSGYRAEIRIYRDTWLLRTLSAELSGTPPACSFAAAPNPFSPDGDQSNDRMTFTLADGTSLVWDGRDQNRVLLPEGCYFAELAIARPSATAVCRAGPVVVCLEMNHLPGVVLLYSHPNPARGPIRLQFPCDPPFSQQATLPSISVYTLSGDRVWRHMAVASECHLVYRDPHWYGEIVCPPLRRGVYAWTADYGAAWTALRGTFAVLHSP